MSPYRSAISNTWVIMSAFWRWTGHVTVQGCRFESVGKHHPPKPPRQRTAFFFYSKLFVCNSIGNYQRKVFVGSYRLNYGWKNFCRYFLPQITDKNILSVNPLLLGEFLVVFVISLSFHKMGCRSSTCTFIEICYWVHLYSYFYPQYKAIFRDFVGTGEMRVEYIVIIFFL